ncbi:MAG: hypothetical protein RQ723_11965 [Desulfuromonadales bacterium]|nr:hypothetical protein [Desulfuromonadales bacterium]
MATIADHRHQKVEHLLAGSDEARHLVAGQFLQAMQDVGVAAAVVIHHRGEHRDHIVEIVPVVRTRVGFAAELGVMALLFVAPVFEIKIRRFDLNAHGLSSP